MSTSKLSVAPYLYFYGQAEEAMEFYEKAVGARRLMMVRFKEAPPGSCPSLPPGWENKVMHARLLIGDANVMISDGSGAKKPFDGFSLSLNVSSPAEAEKLFEGLKDGGQVTMPMSKTFFSPAFAMVKDRFGLHWMIYAEQGS